MKKTFYTLLITLILSCSHNPEHYIQHIDGYWEIESVTLSSGLKKEYTSQILIKAVFIYLDFCLANEIYIYSDFRNKAEIILIRNELVNRF